MKSISSRWFQLAAACSMFFLLWSEHVGRGVAAPTHTPVIITRIFTGADAQTHAEQTETEFTMNAIYGREQSGSVKASSTYFVRFPPGFTQDWHPASERRYLVTLSGKGEIELATGQKIPLEPGRVLRAEDLSGKGHITRTVSKTDWTVMYVQIDQ
jgi:hypothetical protein